MGGLAYNKGLERMVDIQLQVQNLVKLATVTNIKLINIKTNLLQFSEIYKKPIRGDVYSIVNKLQMVIHRDIKRQIYHIQKLLADELNRCKRKENVQVDEHI